MSKSARYTEDQKREFIQLFRDGELNRSNFCKEMGISPMSLDKWLRDYGEAAEESLKLVEVKRASVEAANYILKVHLPSGLICEIGEGLNRTEMINWIRELKEC